MIAAVANAVLNALIAWLFTLGEEVVPLWAIPLVGGPSVITDSVGTFFVLTFLTTLVVTTTAWHEIGDGRLQPLDFHGAWGRFVARLPRTRRRRAVYLGLLCMAVLGPPTVVVLVALDFGDLSIGDFVLYKAVFGVVLGALVTPLIALAAMARAGIEPATP